MANQLWAPLNISYWQHLQQVTVTLTSDVPCHLWLRWSWSVPRKHPKTDIRRGLPVFSEVYLCFDVYQDIEQNEVGDTLTHTFWLWVFDETTLKRQTIYFYFWGEIATVKSPSETAIFTYIYHRRYEFYWPAWDAAWGLSNGWLQSQSFTADYDHEFTKVHVHIAHRYDPCTIHAFLYRAGSDHAPTGNILAIGSHEITSYHDPWSWWDARIYLTAWPILDPGRYVAAAYQEGDDTNQNFGKTHYLAQTFTPLSNFHLFRIKLKVWQMGDEGPVFLKIYHTDIAGKPTGVPIATSQTSGKWWDIYSPGNWVQWDFYFPLLLAGTKYAMVLSCPTAVMSWDLKARKDAGDATYPVGNFLLSTDSGASWTPSPNDDLMFIMWNFEAEAATRFPTNHLKKGTEYCIVLTQIPPAPAQTQWRGNTASTYPHGIHSRHELAGYWEPKPTEDLNFSEWGYPPKEK